METIAFRCEDLAPEAFRPRPDSGAWGRAFGARSGERVLLVGASGSGKSTLAGLLYGARSDARGGISVLGEDPRALSPEGLADFRRLRVACVFQDLRLLDGLTARENLLLKAELSGKGYALEIERHAEALGVARLLDARAGILSRGEKQRFAIVRALLQDFGLVILDEFTSHLDEANARNAAALVDAVASARGAAVACFDIADNDLFSYAARIAV